MWRYIQNVAKNIVITSRKYMAHAPKSTSKLYFVPYFSWFAERVPLQSGDWMLVNTT